MAESDGVSGPIIFDHARVIYGNVGGALLEVGHGIAARGHQFIDESVGLRNGACRLVDELRLHGSPAFGEIKTAFLREGTESEFLAALGAHFEDTLGAAHLTFFFQHAIIFRTEALAELLAAAPARQHESDHGNHYNCHDHNDQERELTLIHVASALELSGFVFKWRIGFGDGERGWREVGRRMCKTSLKIRSGY